MALSAVTTALVLAVCGFPAHARRDGDGTSFYRHELRLSAAVAQSVNGGAYSDGRTAVEQCFGVVPGGDAFWGIDRAVGAAASYLYHVNARLAVGVSAARAVYQEDMSHGGSAPVAIDGWDYAGTLRNRVTSVMPTVKVRWLSLRGVDFYSRCAAGLMWQHVYYDAAHPAGQHDYTRSRDYDDRRCRAVGHVAPLAIETTAMPLRLFAELGYGVEGLFSLGVSYSF